MTRWRPRFAGKLHVLREGPSSLGDPSQKADSVDSEQTIPKNLTMHDSPDQKVESEKTTEFDRRIPMLIEIFCGTAGVIVHISSLLVVGRWALIIVLRGTSSRQQQTHGFEAALGAEANS